MEKEKQEIQKELDKLITNYYGGSFARMACDYLHAIGMTPQEVEELVEALRQGMTKNG